MAMTLRCTWRHGCAEGHADADLLGVLGDGVGDDAVDAERGEQQAEGGEGGDQQHEEAARRVGVVHESLDGAELGGGLLWIEVAQRADDAGGQAAGGRVVRTTSSAPLGPAWVTG